MQRWSDAVADFEAAMKINPACESIFRAQLAEAREKLKAAGGK
jgi:hypothetical protein